MSEPTGTPDESTTQPTPAAAAPPPPPPAYVAPEQPRRSRLTAVAACVGIVAGIVFIVAVIFFSGFVLGTHSAKGGHHRGGDRDFAFIHRGGPPMGPGFGHHRFGPGFGPGFERPGPGFERQGPGAPESPQSPAPTTTAPARP